MINSRKSPLKLEIKTYFIWKDECKWEYLKINSKEYLKTIEKYSDNDCVVIYGGSNEYEAHIGVQLGVNEYTKYKLYFLIYTNLFIFGDENNGNIFG